MRKRERWRRDFVMTLDGERTRENGNGNMASGNGRTRTVEERKLERRGREVRGRERWRRDFAMTSDGERTG